MDTVCSLFMPVHKLKDIFYSSWTQNQVSFLHLGVKLFKMESLNFPQHYSEGIMGPFIFTSLPPLFDSSFKSCEFYLVPFDQKEKVL